MDSARYLHFDPFCLDRVGRQLWRGTQLLPLQRKPLAVLCHLVEHAGEVVAKEELLTAVWSQVRVNEEVLTVHVRALRKVLGDNAKAPRFIETVHGRGYRFIAAVTATIVPTVEFRVSRSSPSSVPHLQRRPSILVGREAELARLHGCLAKAINGERQIVFVTGEPGIGKTTLVEAFLLGLQDRPLLGRGQCVEHHGIGEAYMPVLEALGRLCRENEGPRVMAVLDQYAPTWLAQLPSVLSAVELHELQRRTVGVTPARMLRELAEALEALSAERTLILRIEDLHWSDYSTVDVLSTLARRHEAARLLILATYRPGEALLREHPLNGMKRELQIHGLCEELALDFLDESMVAEYLAQRFQQEVSQDSPFQQIARVIHQRTDGSPLFMVNVVNDLIVRDVVRQTSEGWELRDQGIDFSLGTPLNLRQMIKQQLERLGAEAREMLEVASVVGADFSAAAVAAGTAQSIEAVEKHCDTLVRQAQFLCSREPLEWPDRTVAARYAFVHALYQEVLYEQLSLSQRIRLHRQVGERLEQGYGDQARDIAAELAVHFEQGQAYDKAVWYHQQAGHTALQRSANHEALTHLRTATALLKGLPASTARLQQELDLQTALGSVLIATKGYAAPETGAAYTQAEQLCHQLADASQLFPVLAGLWGFHATRPNHETALKLGQQLLGLAESRRDTSWRIEAHWTLGALYFCRGELAAARLHLEQSISLDASQDQRAPAFLYGHDPVMSSLCFVSHALWHLGYPEQALQSSQAAVTLAGEVAHPYSQAYALVNAAWCHWLRREESLALEQAEAGMKLSDEHGIPLFSSMGAVLYGRALVEQGEAAAGIEKIRHGLLAYQATGAEMLRSYFLVLLADALGQTGQTEAGLNVVAEALTMVNTTGERIYEAELYRLKGELLLAKTGSRPKAEGSREKTAEAEECFQQAIKIARKQQAKSLELRATMSLARLWQQRRKKEKARKMLAEVYSWFTEGFDTKDLQDAKALLASLSN